MKRIALTYNLRSRGSLREAEAEFDTRATIDALAAIVTGLGHTAVPIDVSCTVPALVGRLRRAAPDLVFNLAEGSSGAFREAFYPALFEQLGLAHTGSSASALAISLDKSLAKRVVATAGVPTPRSILVRDPADLEALAELDDRRVIAKPNLEGSSKGITQDSVVDDPARLPGVVEDLLSRYPAGILVEELIDGTDVSVGWVDGLGLLAPIGFAYEATGPHAILDYALKHGPPERVKIEVPASIPGRARALLTHHAMRTFEALGVEGYGRADFRITPAGDPWFLEMNPLPTLAPSDQELYLAAAFAGQSPSDLIAAILDAVPRPRISSGETRLLRSA